MLNINYYDFEKGLKIEFKPKNYRIFFHTVESNICKYYHWKEDKILRVPRGKHNDWRPLKGIFLGLKSKVQSVPRCIKCAQNFHTVARVLKIWEYRARTDISIL